MRSVGSRVESAGCCRREGAPRARGFTLIELMTTLAVLIVLLTLAAPAFTSFLHSNRLRAAQSELVASLMLARSEAGRRGRQVGVEALQPVGNGGFTAGWRVWVDADANGSYDSGETVLRDVPAQRPPLTIDSGAEVRGVVFAPSGFLVPAAAVTFKLCGTPGQGKGYQVLLEPVGLTDITEVSTCP